MEDMACLSFSVKNPGERKTLYRWKCLRGMRKVCDGREKSLCEEGERGEGMARCY